MEIRTTINYFNTFFAANTLIGSFIEKYSSHYGNLLIIFIVGY
jgi:hypothetical protein